MHASLARRLALPMYDEVHRTFARELWAWCEAQAPVDHHDADAGTRTWVSRLGAGGWLGATVPAPFSGRHRGLDSRTLTLAREILAYHDGLADFAFAMQGLGSGPLSLEGTDALRQHWLPRVAAGEAIAAFALSEPDAGSDVGAMQLQATRIEDGWRLTGEKTWISNGGIADFYCVFARTDGEAQGAKGIGAFLVPATAPGLHIAERLHVVAPHPLARLHFDGCLVLDANRLGAPGEGFKLAMRTLDIFRTSVAAAAVGFAARALDAALTYAATRRMFGSTLGAQPLAQATLGQMAADLDAGALLTLRAAWLRDVGGDPRATSEAAMAKLQATELGQRIVDQAVQLHGGRGVQEGSIVERLYREIRALRIYEGASEVQQLIIGRQALAARSETRP